MAHENRNISSEYLIASLSYVGILVLIPIIAGEYTKPFVKFHIKQGIVILIGMIISIILAQYASRVGSVLFLLFFVTTLLAFFRTVQGEKWRIPGIAHIAELFPVY